MNKKYKVNSFKNYVFTWFQKFVGLEEKEQDPWAKNLFNDLERLGGRLIVMRMG